jgi:hypothetical protein
MTDPQQFTADQIGQIGTDVTGATASAADVAAQAAEAASPIGVTEADIDGIKAMLAAMETRLVAAERDRQAAAPPALVSTVESLQGFLAGHGDPAAVTLGQQLHDEAVAATESGDTAQMAAVGAKLAAHLLRHPPYPGENYHYRQAADWAQNHVNDAIGAFVPPVTAGA